VTEALKTGNIKTGLSILRTIDEEKLEYRRCSHISSTSNTSATLRAVSVLAASDEPSHSLLEYRLCSRTYAIRLVSY